ncbi:MAG: hypothetical protein AB8F95_22305 [Bacteroidia bacterium]
MEIYCLEDFKVAFEKLATKKSYRDLESQIIGYFFNKTPAELASGTRLNHSNTTPYIKKRLAGSGGYRTYYLLIIREDSLYLMFVHPKTGKSGSSNITDESKAYLYKKVLEAIEDNSLYRVTEDSGKLIFEKN